MLPLHHNACSWCSCGSLMVAKCHSSSWISFLIQKLAVQSWFMAMWRLLSSHNGLFTFQTYKFNPISCVTHYSVFKLLKLSIIYTCFKFLFFFIQVTYLGNGLYLSHCCCNGNPPSFLIISIPLFKKWINIERLHLMGERPTTQWTRKYTSH